jgi:branched-subunit amino acid permease
VLMLVVPLLHLHYPAAVQMDALRISMKSSMSSRRSFSSQLLWRTFACVYFSAVSYSNGCLVETFGHVITV